MEQEAIKPPNSSHSAGKLMFKNYINFQIKENDHEKDFDYIVTLSLFDSNKKKNHKRLHSLTKMVLRRENIGCLCLHIFLVTLSFLLFFSILKRT